MEHKTLGILGGGQLGRMSAVAAIKLGIDVVIFTDDKNAPATRVTDDFIIADYGNKQALDAFIDKVDTITYEFENIPLETVRYLQKKRPVLPGDRLLEISQHRVREKQFLNDIGIDTTRWAEVKNARDIEKTMQKWDATSCIIKTCRFGYDGKGQALIQPDNDIKGILRGFKAKEFIVEEIVEFSFEISVIVARDKLGQTITYPAVLNHHYNHILSKTIAPAPIAPELDKKARDMVELLANSVDLVGVLALEFFVTPEGRLLANEIAPRPHNSGHWTIDACNISQFEQHVRAVCAYPVAHPAMHSDAVMINLIGHDADKIGYFLETPGISLHLYGKREIREGRKMGHITILGPLGEGVDLDSKKALKHYLSHSLNA